MSLGLRLRIDSSFLIWGKAFDQSFDTRALTQGDCYSTYLVVVIYEQGDLQMSDYNET